MAGLKNFMANIGKHLKKGLMDWLFGALAGAGLTMPENFDLQGIVSIVLQVLGLTYANFRARAVKIVGEPVVAGLEKAAEVFKILLTEGVPGLWRFIKDKVLELKSMVLDAIFEFIREKVIVAGITWIIGLLNPASAFFKACKAIYDIVMFFINRGSQIMALVNAVLDSVGAIAKGNIGVAARFVEEALAKAVPVAIGFLAGLLGLGDISETIRAVIDKAQKPVNTAIDWVINQAVRLGAATLRALRDSDGQSPASEPGNGPETVPAGFPLTDDERSRLYADVRTSFGSRARDVTTPEEANALLAGILSRFSRRGLKAVEFRPVPGRLAELELFAQASEGEPVGQVTAVERIRVSDLTSGYITVLIATLNGRQIGPPHRSRGPAEGDHQGHAETWLLTYLTGGVMSMASRDKPNELDVRITRSPCPECQARILRRLRELREELGFDIHMTIRTASVHYGGRGSGIEAFVDLAMLDDHRIRLEPWSIIDDLDELGIPPEQQQALASNPKAVSRLQQRVEQVRRILTAIVELKAIAATKS
jgi:hypothetical protein